MSLLLKGMDKDFKGEFTLELGKEHATLFDAYGETLQQYPANQAAQYFQMPSFSQSIKYFGLNLDGKIRSFDMAKEDLAEIKAYLANSIVTAGPEAIAAVRSKAIRDTLIGVGCTIGGIVLTVGSYVAAASNPEGGSYVMTWGLVLFGVITLCKGIYGFNQHSQLSRMAENAE